MRFFPPPGTKSPWKTKLNWSCQAAGMEQFPSNSISHYRITRRIISSLCLVLLATDTLRQSESEMSKNTTNTTKQADIYYRSCRLFALRKYHPECQTIKLVMFVLWGIKIIDQMMLNVGQCNHCHTNSHVLFCKKKKEDILLLFWSLVLIWLKQNAHLDSMILNYWFQWFSHMIYQCHFSKPCLAQTPHITHAASPFW